MKKILIPIIILLSFTLNGQKVSLKNASCSYGVTQLPMDVLNESIKTYSVMISSNSKTLWSIGLNKTDIERDYLKLHGFQRVERKGDLVLKLDIGAFTIIKEEIQESLKSLKGGNTPENKEFQFKFTYSFPVSLTVNKGDEKLSAFKYDMKASTNVFFSPKYGKSSIAYANKSKYIKSWFNAEKKKRLLKAAAAIYKGMNDKYGYFPISETIELSYAKVKKRPDLQGLKDEVLEVKKLLAEIRSDEPITDELKRSVNNILAIWKKAGDDTPAGDKHQLRLKAAYYSNVMKVSAAIEDFATAEEYANNLTALNKEKKAAKNMLKKVVAIRESFERTGKQSRHFPSDIAADYQPSDGANTDSTGKVDYVEKSTTEDRNKELGIHEDAEEYEAKIEYTNGTSFEGIFVVDYSMYKDAVFFRGGNVKLFQEKDGLITQLGFDLRKIKSFKLGDRDFVVFHPRSGLAVGGQAAGPSAVELIEATDKMELYINHPNSKKSLNEGSLTGNFMMRKPGDKLQDLNSVKYLRFKKAFSKYISDCPSVSKRVKDGEFKRASLVDLTKLVYEYTNNCK